MIRPIDILLWVVAPYLVLVVLTGGTVWRYRYDKFGWTTRSSQLHESRLLRIGNPMFHYGLFLVIGGHVTGLLVPKRFTELAGVTEARYHLTALLMVTCSGLAAVAGLAVLVWRRLRTRSVRMKTTRNDKLTYATLALAMLAGVWTTLVDNGWHGPYDYRETVSPWFRDLFLFDPHPELMAHAPLDYQLHVLIGLGLFALWPFSRLVHAFSASLHYFFRPYSVYRSRTGEILGVRPPRRGWERV